MIFHNPNKIIDLVNKFILRKDDFEYVYGDMRASYSKESRSEVSNKMHDAERKLNKVVPGLSEIISRLMNKRPPNAQIKELQNEISELRATFNLMHEADMRAIKLWQETTGKDMIWPDRTKLIEWLLYKLEAKDA